MARKCKRRSAAGASELMSQRGDGVRKPPFPLWRIKMIGGCGMRKRLNLQCAMNAAPFGKRARRDALEHLSEALKARFVFVSFRPHSKARG